jgi:hypothetical protein
VSNWELTSYDSSLPAILECLYPKVASGHWDLYVLFSYRAASLTNPDGFHSFIVPSSLATEKYAMKLRQYLLTQSKLIVLVNFGQHLVFEDVARQYLIYVMSPVLPDGNVSRIVRYEQNRFEITLSIPQEQFLEFPNYSLRVDLSYIDLALKSKLDRLSIELGTLCCVNVGVVAHSRVGSPIIFKKDDVISYQDGPGRKKYVEGRNIGRYETDWNGLFIDYEAKREFFHRPKFSELFEYPKVMVRRVSGAENTILSCYDEEQYYTNDNVIHVVLWSPRLQELQSPGNYEIQDQVSNYDLWYIAAVMNSRLISHFFASFLATDTLQGSYTGVYPEDVRKLPIRCIEFTTPPEERARFAEAGQSLYAQYLKTGDRDHLLTWVRKRFTQIKNWDTGEIVHPEQADVVHDLLAYLAERMIDLNKAKGAEVRGFLDWLAGYTGLPVDDWVLKTHLRRYYEYDWAEMQRVLKRNQRKLPKIDLDVDAYKNAPAARVRAAWDASMDKLRPLLADIAATDRLIDRVVYQLYGLTEEEIAIVEGRADK